MAGLPGRFGRSALRACGLLVCTIIPAGSALGNSIARRCQRGELSPAPSPRRLVLRARLEHLNQRPI